MNDNSLAKRHWNTPLIGHAVGDIGHFSVMKKTLWAPPSLVAIKQYIPNI